MSVMFAMLEESFRSLFSKSPERSVLQLHEPQPLVKKRSLESYEEAPVAKRPRLLIDEGAIGRKASTGSGFTKLFESSKETFSRFKSWIMKGVGRDKEKVTADPVRRPPRHPLYYQPGLGLGANFSNPYQTASRPSANPVFEYRAPMTNMRPGHDEVVGIGRGAVPKITPQASWNKTGASVKVPQRQLVKNTTGVPCIQQVQSQYLHTPYRAVQDRLFSPDGSANHNNSGRSTKVTSGVNEATRLRDIRRYAEILKKHTSIPLQQTYVTIGKVRPTVFGGYKPKDASENLSNPFIVDLCSTPANITFSAERKSCKSVPTSPMNLNAWERKFSLKQRNSTPITQQPKKQTPIVTPSPKPKETISHEIGAKSPSVAAFEKTMKEAKCMTTWIEDVAESLNSETLRKEREIREAQLQLKLCEEQKDQWEKEMVHRIKTRLKLAAPEQGVIEDVYEEEEEAEDEFPELGDQAEQMINMAFRPGPPGQKLSEGFRIQISRADMATLSGLNWLNDEIINFYMEMIKERGEAEDRPKIHAFNTFFYPKISQSGQQSVRRWTKRVNVFEKDFLLIPVHLGMHWCLCVVSFKEKAIKFYDSMKGQGSDILHTVKQYLIDEKKEKQGEVFDMSDWNLITIKDIPPQLNGSDCGVFACKYADYISLNKKITFTQSNMPYFRRRMVYEILKKKLLMT